MVNFRRVKLVSESKAKQLLGASEGEWKTLVSEGLLDLAITRTKRGVEVRTDVHSLERASARLPELR